MTTPCHKVTHATYKDAQAALRVMRHGDRTNLIPAERMGIYHCRACNGWHIGAQSGNARARKRKRTPRSKRARL